MCVGVTKVAPEIEEQPRALQAILTVSSISASCAEILCGPAPCTPHARHEHVMHTRAPLDPGKPRKLCRLHYRQVPQGYFSSRKVMTRIQW